MANEGDARPIFDAMQSIATLTNGFRVSPKIVAAALSEERTARFHWLTTQFRNWCEWSMDEQ